MHRLWVLLLLLPLAAAGPDEPEVTDVAGDATAGRGDLIAAWVEEVTPTNVDVVFQLAELAAEDSLRLELTWTTVGPFGPNQGVVYGVRVWVTPSGQAAEEIRSDGNGGPSREVVVAYGTPGEVRVAAVWTGGLGWGGGLLSDFEASSFVVAPLGPTGPLLNGGPQADGAGPMGAFQHAFNAPHAALPWTILGDRIEGDLSNGGALNIRAGWFGQNGTGFDLTVQFDSLTHEDAANCANVGVFHHVKESGPTGKSLGGLSTVRFVGGWVDWQHDNADVSVWQNHDIVDDLDYPFEVRWVFGTPGYFQLKGHDVPFEDWEAPVSVSATCGNGHARLREQGGFPGLPDGGEYLVLPLFFGIVGGILMSIWIRKKAARKQRRG